MVAGGAPGREPQSRGEWDWYAMEVTKERHACAFDRVEPQHRISALELFGTVMLMRLAAKHHANLKTNIAVTARTDSQCNSYALLKTYSRKVLAAVIHMELAETAEVHNLCPRVSHVTRDKNTWADQLTESDMTGFLPEKRWTPNMDNKFFYVLDKLMGLREIDV